ncbi:MAG: M28 family peptidase, partial [Proteobacteria bacterium]|nr:M28 family peptidase [Pseudomonadota bacterium]
VPEFDANRAFDILVAQTEYGPRSPGSSGHRKCLDFLASTLRGFTDSISLLPFSVTAAGVSHYGTNIFARFGEGNVGRILLSAHWDTRPSADQETDPRNHATPILGANDGASGVAVLLEIASLLKSSPPPVGVDIVLFDLEDSGTPGIPDSWSIGARDFAQNHLRVSRYSFGINVDMVGDAELEIRREGNSEFHAGPILDRVFSTARLLGIPEFVDEPGPEVTDDHMPLIEAGLPTIDLIDFDYPDASNSYWHTLQDTPDKCSPQSLGAVGTVLLHIIYATKAN